MKILIAICTLAVFASLAVAERLEGHSNKMFTHEYVDETPLDPTANSGIFIHDRDMTYVLPPDDFMDFEKYDKAEYPEEDSSDDRKKRNAVSSSAFLWPGGIVPYVISPNFNENERRTILLGMQEWEDKTCIRFVPMKPSDRYCIQVLPSTPGFCASYIGRLYYYPDQCQGIALGAGCVNHGTVLHELGHAIGFHHEQNRPDRDEYVTINVNPNSSIASQVQKRFYTNTLGLGYDYASIMHYESLGGLIEAKEDVPFGNAEELSPLDILKTNKLYNCPAHQEQPVSKLEPVPPSWSLPDGVTCGEYIRVDKSGSFRFPGGPKHKSGQNCTYVLEAPKGYGFDFSFPDLNTRFGSYRYPCSSQYIQLLDDASLSSYNILRYPGRSAGRICERNDYRTTFFADNNIVTINYKHNSGTPINFKVNYVVRDVNECNSFHHCHQCTNLKGAYRCDCNDGYYHSYAANTCYDVNECSFNNGGCKGKCVNRAGSYECTCEPGLFLQEDGKSCGSSPPSKAPTALPPGTQQLPSTAIPTAVPTTLPPPTTTPPPTTPPTTQKPTTPPTTQKPTTPPTTQKPTTPPTTQKPTTPPTTPKPTTPPTTQKPTTPPTTPKPTTAQPTTPPTTIPPPAECAIPSTSGVRSTCFAGIRAGTTFASEAFPNYLRTSVRYNCRFLLLGEAGKTYQLRLKYVDLPSDASCNDISINVRQTWSSTGPLIRKICPSEVQSCGDIVVPLGSITRVLVEMTGTLAKSARGLVGIMEEV